jgi:hypothetical protein
MSFARYTIGIGALLAVISGFGLTEVAKKIFPNRALFPLVPGFVGLLVALNLVAVVTLSLVPSPVRDKFCAISPFMQFLTRIEQVANFLHPRLSDTDKIIIDNFNDEAPAIAAALHLPVLAEDEGRAFFASHRITEVSTYLTFNHPKYVIYSPRGALRTQLQVPDRCGSQEVLLLQIGFRCIYQNESYAIYESTQ